MKIVNGNDVTHTIYLIPRTYNTDSVSISIIDETTKESLTGNVLNYIIMDGEASLEFNVSEGLTNKKKYSLKVLNTTESGVDVLYRGKILATTQEAQDYKLTKDLYFYE